MPTGVCIGVDVGGTKVLGVAVDGGGSVVATHRVPTPVGGEALMGAVHEVVDRLRAAGTVAGVGVGMPGLVDREGVLHVAPNLPGVVGLQVGALVAAHTRVPVRVDNDATCATWAERQVGAARGHDDAVVITLGTGIGGGLVSGGRLMRGRHGFAGEVGHMVVDPDGPACPCGRRGCWERYASGGGLGRMAREAVAEGRAARVLELAGGEQGAVRGEHVTTAALEGDEEAAAIVADLAGWLALGLVNLTNLLDPSVLVVGGGLIANGDLLLGPARARFHELLPSPELRPPVPIVAAELGEEAGAVGAALLVRDAPG